MLIIKKREQEREDDYREMMLSTLHKVYAQILAEIKGGNTRKKNSAS